MPTRTAITTAAALPTTISPDWAATMVRLYSDAPVTLEFYPNRGRYGQHGRRMGGTPNLDWALSEALEGAYFPAEITAGTPEWKRYWALARWLHLQTRIRTAATFSAAGKEWASKRELLAMSMRRPPPPPRRRKQHTPKRHVRRAQYMPAYATAVVRRSRPRTRRRTVTFVVRRPRRRANGRFY